MIHGEIMRVMAGKHIHTQYTPIVSDPHTIKEKGDVSPP